MTRRAPGQIRVRCTACGAETGPHNFRNLVLQKIQGDFTLQLLVPRQSGKAVFTGAVAVHQYQRNATVDSLLGNDIQKRQTIFYLQQGFGFFQAHTGAQAPIEL